MKLLGVLSPAKNSAVSLDLLNLYIVNQISCKKEMSETVRKPIHVNMNRDIKLPLRKHDLELPMSPNCVPSKLCLDDTENNIYCQRLGSKEELGSVQSSQVMDSCSMSEPQFNRIENCRFSPPSLSAELSSDSRIPKQNFTPQVTPSPWKVAYEKKQNEQPSNVNYSRSLLPKLNESQDAPISSYKAAQFGTLFERLNSPGNGNFLTKRPAIIMDEDYGSLNERRESDFIKEKQTVQPFWGENRKAVLNCLEDANQPIPSSLSENCDSFTRQNMINLLNLDQQRLKENIDKCGCDSIGDICAITSSSKNYFTERRAGSIFIVPKLTYSNSTFNKTSNPENCQPNQSYQKEYNNNERKNFGASFETHCYPASSEKTGKYENNYQKKIPQKKIQKYPLNNMGNIPLEELHSKQSWDIGLGEILMEERRTCSLKSSPTSTKKIHLDSSQSSQSTSYSPRQTDSCFSSSSEMPSEDEDQILQQSEDSNRRRFIKTKETSNNVYLNMMSKLPDDRIIKNNASIDKQNEIFHRFSMKNNSDQFPQSQYNSAYILQNKTNNDCILQAAKCDAWVQTESEHAIKEKLDAAIQCDIISKCKCRSDVSSLCNTERCSENIKADTTGGQEILKNN
ncbi:regulator of DNA class I crossover intermediates 1 [Dugong dugon]